MRYKATLTCDSDGCEATSDELAVTVRAPTAASALSLLRDEIRYRIEPSANAVRKWIAVTNEMDKPVVLSRIAMFD